MKQTTPKRGPTHVLVVEVDWGVRDKRPNVHYIYSCPLTPRERAEEVEKCLPSGAHFYWVSVPFGLTVAHGRRLR